MLSGVGKMMNFKKEGAFPPSPYNNAVVMAGMLMLSGVGDDCGKMNYEKGGRCAIG